MVRDEWGGRGAARGGGEDRGADRRLFPGDGSAIVFYGHHHHAADIRGRARYVSPGALGRHTEAVARYAILEIERHGQVRLRREAAHYDAAPLFRAFEERQVPARAFIRRTCFGQPG